LTGTVSGDRYEITVSERIKQAFFQNISKKKSVIALEPSDHIRFSPASDCSNRPGYELEYDSVNFRATFQLYQTGLMKRILIIQTGGTIAMQINDNRERADAFSSSSSSSSSPSVSVTPPAPAPAPALAPASAPAPVSASETLSASPSPLPADWLQKRIPELSGIARINVADLFFKDSSDMNPGDWRLLAETIRDNYASYDGFVILHGTDTMAYTASALSFCLNNLGKPVILTGSQIPMAVIRSDASRNLINAIEMATLPLNEVAICFNDHIYRGNRSTKTSVGDFDAFSFPNHPPLASIGLNVSLNYQITPNPEKFFIAPAFDERLCLIRLFPGLNPDYLMHFAESDVRAIVIEAFGCGNFPVSGRYSLVPFFRRCLERDILLVISSQAPQDAVDLSKYQSGRQAESMGIISAGDMTTEASVTKMMYLLAQHENPLTVRNLYSRPIAGEITVGS
jgi:L-asparaginase